MDCYWEQHRPAHSVLWRQLGGVGAAQKWTLLPQRRFLLRENLTWLCLLLVRHSLAGNGARDGKELGTEKAFILRIRSLQASLGS